MRKQRWTDTGQPRRRNPGTGNADAGAVEHAHPVAGSLAVADPGATHADAASDRNTHESRLADANAETVDNADLVAARNTDAAPVSNTIREGDSDSARHVDTEPAIDSE